MSGKTKEPVNADVYTERQLDVDGTTYTFAQFEGISAIDRAECTNASNIEKVKQLEDKESESWYGIPNMSGLDCINLFRTGWEKGVKDLRKRAHDFSLIVPMSRTTQTRPRQTWGEEGDTIELQNLLCGDLDHLWHGMQRRTFEDLKTRVHIIADVTGNCGENASTLKWSGILAAVLAAKAMENGYDVKITGAISTKNMYQDKDDKYVGFIPVKKYDESISLANLAPLMTPAFFRGVGFKAFFLSPDAITGGIGQPAGFSADLAREAMGAGFDDGTPLLIGQIRSESAALDTYRKLVKEVTS